MTLLPPGIREMDEDGARRPALEARQRMAGVFGVHASALSETMGTEPLIDDGRPLPADLPAEQPHIRIDRETFEEKSAATRTDLDLDGALILRRRTTRDRSPGRRGAPARSRRGSAGARRRSIARNGELVHDARRLPETKTREKNPPRTNASPGPDSMGPASESGDVRPSGGGDGAAGRENDAQGPGAFRRPGRPPRRLVHPLSVRALGRGGAPVSIHAGGGSDAWGNEPALASRPRTVLRPRSSRNRDHLGGVGARLDVARAPRRRDTTARGRSRATGASRSPRVRWSSPSAASAWFAASGMEVVPFAWLLTRTVRRAAEWVERPRRIAATSSLQSPKVGELVLLAALAPLMRPEGAIASFVVAGALAAPPARRLAVARARAARGASDSVRRLPARDGPGRDVDGDGKMASAQSLLPRCDARLRDRRQRGDLLRDAPRRAPLDERLPATGWSRARRVRARRPSGHGRASLADASRDRGSGARPLRACAGDVRDVSRQSGQIHLAVRVRLVRRARGAGRARWGPRRARPRPRRDPTTLRCRFWSQARRSRCSRRTSGRASTTSRRARAP